MKKSIRMGIGLLALLLILFACDKKGPEHAAPAPTSRQQALNVPSNRTKAAPSEIEAMVQEAEKDFEAARYDETVLLLRNILPQSPGDRSLWILYDRAVLARSGDNYLRTMPFDRYRVDVRTFYKDSQGGNASYFILDVRDPREFDDGHLKGAVNVPLRQVLQHLDVLPGPKSGKTVLVVCNTQHRANHVIVLLRELGYDNAFTLHGGYQAYVNWLKKNHLPLNGLKKTRDVAPSPKSPGDSPEKEEDFGC
jgi:rhodanese-related sulfurtransferase